MPVKELFQLLRKQPARNEASSGKPLTVSFLKKYLAGSESAAPAPAIPAPAVPAPAAKLVGLVEDEEGGVVAAMPLKPDLEVLPLKPDEESAELVLELGDFLGRIPDRLLKSGEHDLHLPLAFDLGEIASRLALGISTITIAELLQRVPQVFETNAQSHASMTIRFPWQKVMAMIKESEVVAAENGSEPLALKLKRRRDRDQALSEGVTEGPAGAKFRGTTQIKTRGMSDRQSVWFSPTKGAGPGSAADRAPGAGGPTPKPAAGQGLPSRRAAAAMPVPPSGPDLVALPEPKSGPNPAAVTSLAAPPDLQLLAAPSSVPPANPDQQAEPARSVDAEERGRPDLALCPETSASHHDVSNLRAEANRLGPEGGAEMERNASELAAAVSREGALLLAEKEKQLAKLEAEYSAVIAAQQKKILEMRAARDHVSASERERLAADFERKIAELSAERELRLEALKAESDRAAAELTDQAAKRIAELEAKHEEAQARLLAEKEAEIQALATERDAAMASKEAELARVRQEHEMRAGESRSGLHEDDVEALEALEEESKRQIASLQAEAERRVSELKADFEREQSQLLAEKEQALAASIEERETALAAKEIEIERIKEEHERTVADHSARSEDAVAQLRAELNLIAREVDLAASRSAEHLALVAAEHENALASLRAEADRKVKSLEATLAQNRNEALEKAIAETVMEREALTAARQVMIDDYEQRLVRLTAKEAESALENERQTEQVQSKCSAITAERDAMAMRLEVTDRITASMIVTYQRTISQLESDIDHYRERVKMAFRERDAALKDRDAIASKLKEKP
jgi:hypothetical protein